jgi:hypothetical protein
LANGIGGLPHSSEKGIADRRGFGGRVDEDIIRMAQAAAFAQRINPQPTQIE